MLFPGSRPAFSCSLVGLEDECIPSFPISLKSDNIVEEQNSCRGGGAACALSRESLTEWGLFSSQYCPWAEAPDRGEESSGSHLFVSAPLPLHRARPPKSATHCCLGLESKSLTGFLKTLELVIPAASSCPRAGQRGWATCAAHGQSAALPGSKPAFQALAGPSRLRPRRRTSPERAARMAVLGHCRRKPLLLFSSSFLLSLSH